ncbi:MAG: class I SAM-dependent methyltransferase [Sphingomicrobium sp.]
MIDRLKSSTGRSIFGADVMGYHGARVGYPEQLYEAIASRFGSRRIDDIGEIGPGTGLASARLARFSPQRFVGFEPDPSLVAHLCETVPAMQVIHADFVDAEVEGGFDLIAAAACFHWLEPVAALAKVHRLLRPGGCVALWWNVYREAGIGDPFAEAVLPLLDGIALPPSEGASGHYSLDWKLHFRQLVDVGFIDLQSFIFRRERVLTPPMARDLYASFSFVRALEQGRREALLDAIADLVSDRFNGSAPTIILTPMYLAAKLADEGQDTGS